MGKRQRLKKSVNQRQSAPASEPLVALSVGSHKFPVYDGVAAAFGADGRDYPRYEDIPSQYHRGRYADAFSALFFRGGKLEDHGLRLKTGVHRPSFFATYRALASSFAPKHEVKTATCAWLLAEHCEDLPA